MKLKTSVLSFACLFLTTYASAACWKTSELRDAPTWANEVTSKANAPQDYCFEPMKAILSKTKAVPNKILLRDGSTVVADDFVFFSQSQSKPALYISRTLFDYSDIQGIEMKGMKAQVSLLVNPDTGAIMRGPQFTETLILSNDYFHSSADEELSIPALQTVW